MVAKLPQYDYLYLGDNARTPYGNRSFDSVYHYTRQCIEWMFAQDCPLIILACNTASAKALRTIQENDLKRLGAKKRVLGVIRPTTEIIGKYSKTGYVGILGTTGTVQSGSYTTEIKKFFPGIQVFQEACPIWVSLVENDEYLSPGADYFIKKHIDHLLSGSHAIDTILLACTHYPLLIEKINQFIPSGVKVLVQGEIVANSLAAYLQKHREMEEKCSKNGTLSFFTTDSTQDFDTHGTVFFGKPVKSTHLTL